MTDRGAKRVHFWVASVVEAKRFRPNSEIDKIRWAAPDRALRLLSYADERHVLEEARTTPRTVPIVIARHGKAMLRRNWTGKDPLRPLASRGRKQADDLTGLLGAFGVVTVASSSSTRCVQTMRPYARQLRTEVETWSILSEEHGESNPKDVRTLVQRLARTAVQEDRPLVVSGHRPVLPTMFEALGVDPRPLTPGAAAVVHLDAEGETRATEWYRPLR
jgi:8-oxo-dGTP diphosphatase